MAAPGGPRIGLVDPRTRLNYNLQMEDIDTTATIDSDFNFSDDTSDSSDDNDTEPNEKEAVKNQEFLARQQKDLDLLTTILQSQFDSQPLSTQLILTKEAALLFKAYSQHGSYARLSESVMSFLEDGDTVVRKATRKHTEKQPHLNRKTGTWGYKEVEVEKEGLERARLQFTPLPPRAVRKVSEKVKMNKTIPVPAATTDRTDHGPIFRNIAVPTSLRERLGPGGRTRPDPAVDGVPMLKPDELTMLKQEIEQKEAELEKITRNLLKERHQFNEPEGPFKDEYNFEQRDKSCAEDVRGRNHSRNSSLPFRASHNFPISTIPSKPQSQEPPIPSLESLAPPQPILTHDQDTTMTNDPETHSLLTDPTILSFNPADIQLTLPKGTYFPKGALESINNILHLHNLSAQSLLRHLTLKYTPTPILTTVTTSTTNPDNNNNTTTTNNESTPLPSPPLSLFRTAITSLITSQTSTILQPTSSHHLFLTPETRSLLRRFYDEVTGGGHLNHIEVEILTRACRVAGDAVEVFWAERNMQRRGWDALRVWRRCREVERVRGAKGRGGF